MNRHANVSVTVPIDQPEPSAPAFCCWIALMSGLLYDLSAEFGFNCVPFNSLYAQIGLGCTSRVKLFSRKKFMLFH